MLTIIFHIKRVYLLPVLVLTLFFQVGCETAPTTKQGEYTTGVTGIQRANDLVQQANSQPSPAKDHLLLEAANIYLSENSINDALAAIEKAHYAKLNVADSLLYKIISGELALKTHHMTLADPLLQSSGYQDELASQPLDIRIRWHQTRGDLFARTGQPSRSIFEFTREVSLISDPGRIRTIHDKIWAEMGKLSDDEVTNGLYQSSDPEVTGWYKLAADTRLAKGDITLLIQNFHVWQEQNPGHPAAKLPPQNLQKLASLSIFTATRIAIFLPESGDYELAAKTLSDGILSAYYEAMHNGSDVPTLNFYDTNSQDVISLYQRAVNDGADIVIGPLQKEKLSTLALQPTLPIPVLGLNYLEDEPNLHDNLYEYGLSVRDEACQIANGAWDAGYRSAIAIVPDSRLGESATEAFSSQWQKVGGRLLSTTIYNNSQNDYAELLAPPLLISESNQRAARLKRILGKNFDFTPRRRGDIDMVLLVSYPDQGRQIKPALDFQYASDLKIFSTSQIYSGSENSGLDNDLDNIIFTAMPWSIKDHSSGMIVPPADLPSGYRNLFAMGADAYRLHQWLDLLKSVDGTEIRGLTGNLVMGGENQVQRRLPWAEFENGIPVPYPAISLTDQINP